MNRTRRFAALTLLVAPALALGPAVAAHASTTAAPAAAKCNVEVDSAGKYHLWGEGFPAGTTVTYSGSTSGSVPIDKSGRFDLGGLSGAKYVVKTADGKTTVTCAMVQH
ncbi:hypothetical protein [Streptomyces sp. A1547]|uniref:hypothetical protein n=1 Tax=Streptomyces sp. A1547 TaxID=2563105 RepID=UPI00109E3767|nr:hypothetical protein [Streptomyces sp. A1547]THA38273.1 hypothetical protein E6W17_17585 [Streptomyces sp. A1547]